MKTIEAFKTTDGKVFESKADAKIHQIELDLRVNLKILTESKDSSYDFDSEFIDFVIENKTELIDILNK
jgi:hypothetical protein